MPCIAPQPSQTMPVCESMSINKAYSSQSYSLGLFSALELCTADALVQSPTANLVRCHTIPNHLNVVHIAK